MCASDVPQRLTSRLWPARSRRRPLPIEPVSVTDLVTGAQGDRGHGMGRDWTWRRRRGARKTHLERFMTTPRHLLMVAMDLESGRSSEQGDLSLALAGAEVIDLLDV